MVCSYLSVKVCPFYVCLSFSISFRLVILLVLSSLSFNLSFCHRVSSLPPPSSIHPPPTFGSSSNLQPFEIDDNNAHVNDGESDANSTSGTTR